MKHLLAILAIALLTVGPGCGSEDKKGSDSKGESATKGGGGDKGAAKAGGVLKRSAADWHAQYNKMKGMEAINFKSHVEISGKVKRVINEMDESAKLWLDVPPKNWMSLSFKDKGAAVKAKKPAAGADATVLCEKIGGKDMNDNIMMLDCTLK